MTSELVPQERSCVQGVSWFLKTGILKARQRYLGFRALRLLTGFFRVATAALTTALAVARRKAALATSSSIV